MTNTKAAATAEPLTCSVETCDAPALWDVCTYWPARGPRLDVPAGTLPACTAHLRAVIASVPFVLDIHLEALRGAAS